MTTAEKVLPLETGQLGNFEARMLRNFRAAVDDWDEVCSSLGRWEAAHLTDDRQDAAKTQHHDWIQALISWGELVRQSTDHSAFPDAALAARVTARLRHLEDKLALWHGEIALEEQERILQAAFA